MTASPAWSPDGQRVAFIGNQNGTPKVGVISANGGAAQVLKNTDASGTNNLLAWSPSREIIYQQPGVRNYLRVDDKAQQEKPLIQHDQSVGLGRSQTDIFAGWQKDGCRLAPRR